MATRILTTDAVVTAAGVSIPPHSIVTVADDALAAAMIASGRALDMADATTMLTVFGTDRWIAVKVGTGAI